MQQFALPLYVVEESQEGRHRARTKNPRGREQVEGRCAEWCITAAKRGEFHGRWSVVSSET